MVLKIPQTPSTKKYWQLKTTGREEELVFSCISLQLLSQSQVASPEIMDIPKQC